MKRHIARIAILLVLAMDAGAFARAGGGQGFHFSGGGGGGGGFNFGGGGYHPWGYPVGPGPGFGGGGSSIWPLLFIVLLFILYAIYVAQKQAMTNQSSGTSPRFDTGLDRQAIDALRQADPAFDERAFYARVIAAFVKTQAAWTAQDLNPIRPFISDGIHERFGLEFLEQKDLGFRNIMKDVTVNSVRLATACEEGGFDVAAVRIGATAIDYDESTTGHRIRGSSSPEKFVEYWTFLRRRGSRSIPGRDGLMEGHCPNCGAQIQINAGAQCASCHALLRSGRYDWVLAEITQDIDRLTCRSKQLTGIPELCRRDPEFSLTDLEDRASVMFWRKAMAQRLGSVDPLRKIATPDFVKRCAELYHPSPDGRRCFEGDLAVGEVWLVGVLPPDSQFEQAVMHIRWEGQQFVAERAAGPRPVGDRAQHASLYVLGRRPGLLTQAGHGLSSAHCPNCGAPATIDTASACEFCGVVLNDGSVGWVLLDVLSTASQQGIALMSRLRG